MGYMGKPVTKIEVCVCVCVWRYSKWGCFIPPVHRLPVHECWCMTACRNVFHEGSGTHKSSLESWKARVFIALLPFVCETWTVPTRSRAEYSCSAVRAVVCRPYSPDGRLWSLIYELTVKSQPALCSNQQLTQLIFTPFISTHLRRKISLSAQVFCYCLRAIWGFFHKCQGHCKNVDKSITVQYNLYEWLKVIVKVLLVWYFRHVFKHLIIWQRVNGGVHWQEHRERTFPQQYVHNLAPRFSLTQLFWKCLSECSFNYKKTKSERHMTVMVHVNSSTYTALVHSHFPQESNLLRF